MINQVMNSHSSDKRKARLQKELQAFSSNVDGILAQSQNLFANLQKIVSKNRAEKISTLIRNNLNHD